MKKTFCLLALIFYTLSINAQLKVGNNPKNLNLNAILEIESTNKGILFPRLALTQTSSPSPLTTHVQGMIVFNISKTNDVDTGLYYNNGSSWIRVGIFSQDWTISGNSGTNSGSNFIGTTDTAALVFKTQNTERLRILNSNSNGSIGVGVSNPYGRFSNSTLDVVGTNGVGIGPFKSMNWVSDPQNAYIASFANTNLSSSTSGHGVLIKVASNDINTNALDISQNSSISAAGNPILIAKGNGNVGIGNKTPISQLHVTKNGGGLNTILEQVGGSNGNVSLTLRGANGSTMSPTQTLKNDQLISINFQGHNGSNYTGAGGIYVWADSNFNSSSNPTRLSFFTGNNGTTGHTERMRINSNGNIGIGTSPTTKLDINGDLRVRNIPNSSGSIKPLYSDSIGNIVTSNYGKSIIDIIYSNNIGGSIGVTSTGGWSSTQRVNLPFDKQNTFKIPSGNSGIIQLFYGCWGDNLSQSGISNPSLQLEYTFDNGATWTWLGNVSQTFNPTSTNAFRFSLNYSNVFNISSSNVARTIQFRLRAYNPDGNFSPSFIGWYLSSTLLFDN